MRTDCDKRDGGCAGGLVARRNLDLDAAPGRPDPDCASNGDQHPDPGRDRISRWIRIELPSQSGVEGWITTETDYTQIHGDVSNLPFIETEPASPAFIRNCTKHEILILPAEVYLLSKYNTPYNEERFNVGVYQIYDTDIPGNVRLEDISLSEGKTVDVRYDGNGDKSKWE